MKKSSFFHDPINVTEMQQKGWYRQDGKEQKFWDLRSNFSLEIASKIDSYDFYVRKQLYRNFQFLSLKK